jgi:hypothetical protein
VTSSSVAEIEAVNNNDKISHGKVLCNQNSSAENVAVQDDDTFEAWKHLLTHAQH